ncbi:hypothetical protein [Pleionea sediminis]|uniref:hypothetical protein n=1 Tax=Pleionea sediminis TaxID=2569479 RepID=UPI001185E2E8|nr:hypothetical protein [Pleionea sediminis]
MDNKEQNIIKAASFRCKNWKYHRFMNLVLILLITLITYDLIFVLNHREYGALLGVALGFVIRSTFENWSKPQKEALLVKMANILNNQSRQKS